VEEPIVRYLLAFALSSLFAAEPAPRRSEAPERPSVLVVYVSRTGQTEALARAVVDGLDAVEGVDARLRAASDASDEEILGASGILLGTPVHYGSASREAHGFLERLGNLLVGAGELGPGSTPEPRLGGAFVTAGSVASGKELARLDVIAALLNMRFVVVGGEEGDGFGTLGAQATTGERDPGLSASELEEARAFGRRFGSLTLELVR
jgi:NAD(P)H dehydrogenase (quinone)